MTKHEEESAATTAARLAIEVIDAESRTLSISLKPYLEAQRRIEKRMEHLSRKRDTLWRSLVEVTKCPAKTGPYSRPVTRPRPTRESFIKKINGLSEQNLVELALRLDAMGVEPGPDSAP